MTNDAKGDVTNDDPSPADSPKFGEMRPRPQYGEYATPQEQARIIAHSLPPVSALLVPPTVADAASPGASSAPKVRTKKQQFVAGSPVAGGHRPRRWDQILTVMLLGYAAINVIGQLIARDTLAAIVTQFFVTQGIGTYTPTTLSETLGNTLNIVTLALFVLTVLGATWMLRRGRIAFWIPLAGGVAATIVALVFVVVLLQADPAFSAYMKGIRG